MSVSTSYLTTTKNLSKVLSSIQNAQAPKQFSTRFLASLGYPSASDRLVIGVLKALGFLTPEGVPTKRYFEYLDQTQSKRVLADGVRDAYADLFQINRKAYELSSTEIKNKLKTLTQGQVSSTVLDKIASTFKALVQHADFAAPPSQEVSATTDTEAPQLTEATSTGGTRVALGGLVYNIQLILPADRDQAVYDALFRSLKEHLLK
jgi:Family of unknown function (DUF5343)